MCACLYVCVWGILMFVCGCLVCLHQGVPRRPLSLGTDIYGVESWEWKARGVRVYMCVCVMCYVCLWVCMFVCVYMYKHMCVYGVLRSRIFLCTYLAVASGTKATAAPGYRQIRYGELRMGGARCACVRVYMCVWGIAMFVCGCVSVYACSYMWVYTYVRVRCGTYVYISVCVS